MEAAIVAVKVIGTVMAAKSLVEGLKEGNLMKAVLGGVGAYFGMSSLAASAGTAAAEGGMSAAVDTTLEGAASTSLGEALVDSQAGQLATQTAEFGDIGLNLTKDALNSNTGLLTQAGNLSASGGLGQAGNMLLENAHTTGSFADGLSSLVGSEAVNPTQSLQLANSIDLGIQSPAQGLLYDAGNAAQQAANGSGGSFLDKLKEIGPWVKDNKELVQLGGNAVSGIGQYLQNQEIMDWKAKQLQRERVNRGASVDQTKLARWAFDPNARQMVRVG